MLPPETSLLSTHLWDIRANLEAQVRCLTTVQKNVAAFKKASNEIERGHLKTKILTDLKELGDASLIVLRLLKPTIEQVEAALA